MSSRRQRVLISVSGDPDYGCNVAFAGELRKHTDTDSDVIKYSESGYLKLEMKYYYIEICNSSRLKGTVNGFFREMHLKTVETGSDF